MQRYEKTTQEQLSQQDKENSMTTEQLTNEHEIDKSVLEPVVAVQSTVPLLKHYTLTEAEAQDVRAKGCNPDEYVWRSDDKVIKVGAGVPRENLNRDGSVPVVVEPSQPVYSAFAPIPFDYASAPLGTVVGRDNPEFASGAQVPVYPVVIPANPESEVNHAN
jgi:hypothetical protein